MVISLTLAFLEINPEIFTFGKNIMSGICLQIILGHKGRLQRDVVKTRSALGDNYGAAGGGYMRLYDSILFFFLYV